MRKHFYLVDNQIKFYEGFLLQTLGIIVKGRHQEYQRIFVKPIYQESQLEICRGKTEDFP